MKIYENILLRIYELKKKILNIKKRTLCCVICGMLFGVFSFAFNKNSIYVNENEIPRGLYGASKKTYKIKMDVDNLINNVDVGIQVSSKKYTKKEIEKVFKEKMEGLKLQILGDNKDFDNINKKMNFPSNLGDGVNATYSFFPDYKEGLSTISEIEKASISNAKFAYHIKYQKILDGSGNVKNEDFRAGEFCTGYIEIQMSSDVKEIEGKYKSEKYIIPVRIVEKEMSFVDSFINEYKKNINEIDVKTSDKDNLVLPTIFNGYHLIYKEKQDLNYLLMPILGIIVAILLNANDKEKEKEKVKQKIRTMELDFSQIISKILLLVSSGMTIRNSFIRVGEQYKQKLEKGQIEQRIAYDEIVIVKNKLESGYNEIKAYEEMASHLNMRMYTRFLNIIIQSIKNGNKDLKNILNMEVQDALYERKQKAKKLGEEAATKLVLPLMMMLTIIMVVIMVPAFMGM